MELKGKVAIVTGASRGMGLEISKMLAKEGTCVALVGRDMERLQAVYDEITAKGGKASIFPTDIRIAAQVEELVDKVITEFEAIDILVNSAFWGPPASIEETDEAFWDQTLDTCLKGA